jgi:hypothetical protein
MFFAIVSEFAATCDLLGRRALYKGKTYLRRRMPDERRRNRVARGRHANIGSTSHAAAPRRGDWPAGRPLAACVMRRVERDDR